MTVSHKDELGIFYLVPQVRETEAPSQRALYLRQLQIPFIVIIKNVSVIAVSFMPIFILNGDSAFCQHIAESLPAKSLMFRSLEKKKKDTVL